jgi:DNA-binding protein HU-beta
VGRTQRVLADTLSDELGLPRATGRRFLERLLEMVADDLVYTGRIELRGLGTFAAYDRPARQVPHPRTGEPVQVPATRAVRYRTSASLLRRLNPRDPRFRGRSGPAGRSRPPKDRGGGRA